MCFLIFRMAIKTTWAVLFPKTSCLRWRTALSGQGAVAPTLPELWRSTKWYPSGGTLINVLGNIAFHHLTQLPVGLRISEHVFSPCLVARRWCCGCERSSFLALSAGLSSLSKAFFSKIGLLGSGQMHDIPSCLAREGTKILAMMPSMAPSYLRSSLLGQWRAGQWSQHGWLPAMLG